MLYLLLTLLFWLCVGLVGYSYVVYPLLLPLLARLFGRPAAADAGHRPSVGVLVPVHDEQEVIKAKVASILALDYPPEKLSVWVGSDCSSDNTCAIVRGMADPRVHLWEAPSRGGKTGVLNRLAPQVEAEVVVFTDANTMHRRDSLARLVAPFVDPAVGGVAGHIEHAVAGAGKEREERFYRSFESRQKLRESALHSTISAFGGFYAIRKELFRPIPENSYSNDDVLIPMDVIRQGKRMLFEPSAVSYEDTTESLSAEFRRRVRIGAGNYQSLAWLGDFLSPLRGWPWFCYVSHKVCRWLSPLAMLAGSLACAGLCLFGGGALYCWLLAVGLLLALAGLCSRVVPLRPLQHIFYFMAMNLALVLGFVRFCHGIRSAAWQRTERNLAG